MSVRVLTQKSCLLGFLLFGVALAPAQQPAPTDTSQRAFLNRYCITCHNEKLKTAGLMLDKTDVDNVGVAPDVWEKVVRKLQTGAMPPAGMPHPDKAASDSMLVYLETALDRASADNPRPGLAAPHRLNRAEYTNAVRDLLGLDVDGASLLPPDDSGYGFDNIGDVLSVSPMLLNRYMSAARQISRLAIGDPTLRVPSSPYDLPRDRLQNDRSSEDLPFGSRGGMAIRHYFPLDGEYLIKIRLQRISGSGGSPHYILGLGDPHQLDVRLDGEKIKQFTVGGEPKGKSAQAYSGPDYTDESYRGDLAEQEYESKVEAGLELRFTTKAGERQVTIAFRDDSVMPEGMLHPQLVRTQLYGWGPKDDALRDPAVAGFTILGPFNPKRPEDTVSRRKIFVCHPATDNDEELCAKKIVSVFARRAYRRPVTDEDTATLLDLYKTGRSEQDFETGIALALQGILVNPKFLFRIEHDPPKVTPATAYRISDLELASRLSFFLWSSIPDDRLLELAEAGKLRDDEVLREQVRRMLADPRSKALIDNFAGQWLLVRGLRSVAPNPVAFPDFDENLREAFQKETELFFENMLHEDRSVVELLSANYTFVNERLARHYGIPNVYGNHFRRVTLTDENRMGLLGQGSILTVTSYANRTSPVVRGKWVLENILGTPPPPPPPNVPPLDETKDMLGLTMRKRMEEHRSNPACASCHARMDPIGFALDEFDAIGKWRTTEATRSWNGYDTTVTNTPIDASGVLPDGTKFEGPAGLRKYLVNHPGQFVTTLTEKLLTYALGRGIESYDEPAVREIIREGDRGGDRWSALVLGIVKSVPFQMRSSGPASAVAGTQ